jgi:hypothetical protein
MRHTPTTALAERWIPAFAGMTTVEHEFTLPSPAPSGWHRTYPQDFAITLPQGVPLLDPARHYRRKAEHQHKVCRDTRTKRVTREAKGE